MLNNNQLKNDKRKKEEELEERLRDIRLKEKEKAVQLEANEQGLDYINLVGFAISEDALRVIPEERAKQLKTICFLLEKKELRLGVVDPGNEEVKKLVQELIDQKYHVRIYLISEHSFETAVKLYKRLLKIKKVIKGVKIGEKEIENYKKKIKTFRDISREIQKANISEIVSLIIAGAIQGNASDIHIEAEQEGVKLRYRIDGVLHDIGKIDRKLWKELASRIKLLASLKINITDKPQDGQFTIFLTKGEIDVRVSCLPTNYGESIVMRLLMSSAKAVSFEDLGLRGSISYSFLVYFFRIIFH